MNKSPNTNSRIVAALAALIILLICTLTLSEFIFQIDLGIDQLFAIEYPLSPGTIYPGRIAVITIICFIFAAITFLFYIFKQTLGWWTQILAWIIFILSLFSLYNYISGIDLRFAVTSCMAMAIHTVGLFILLSAGLLLLRPDQGLIEVLMRDSQVGYFLRPLLPVVLILPILLTTIENILERHQLFDANFGDAIISVGTFGIFSIIVMLIARRLDREERSMRETHKKLEQSELIAHY